MRCSVRDDDGDGDDDDDDEGLGCKSRCSLARDRLTLYQLIETGEEAGGASPCC